MKNLFKDMTPIEWVGVLYVSFLFTLFVVSFTSLLYAIFTGQVDLSNASFGFAESTWVH